MPKEIWISQQNTSCNESTQVNENIKKKVKNKGHLRSHRPSLEVGNKIVNKSHWEDIITPRNKLVPKVSLLRKLPSQSNERGQSSNYRRIRMNRGVSRTDSISLEESKASNANKLAAKMRSNSVNSNDLLTSKSMTQSNIVKKEINKSKNRLERKSSEKREALTTKSSGNLAFEDFTGRCNEVTNDFQTSRQNHVRCIKKFGVNEPIHKVYKYNKHNKENFEQV